MSATCGTCPYYAAGELDHGPCRRYPPTAETWLVHPDAHACGEHPEHPVRVHVAADIPRRCPTCAARTARGSATIETTAGEEQRRVVRCSAACGWWRCEVAP